MKLSIILPVYNEKNFEILLKKVLSQKISIDKEIIIIESNSTDGTKEVVRKYEGKEGIKIIYENKPNGKGSAVRKGFKIASGDILLIQDADLEYDPKDYQKLIDPILRKEVKFVIGSRKMGHNTWKIRSMKTNVFKAYFINIIANLADTFFNILYDVKLTDPQSMYKVFKKECIKGIEFKSNYFNLDWEICARLIRRGYIPIELPIYYKSRSFVEGKKIKLSRDIFLNIFTIIKYRFIK